MVLFTLTARAAGKQDSGRRNQEDPDMPNPITLTFTVNQFQSLTASPTQLMRTGAGPTADVNVALSQENPFISVGKDGAVTVSRGSVLPLVMVVTGYAALSLVFKQTTGDKDPTGFGAFGTYSRGINGGGSDPNALYFVDNDTPGHEGSWEFYVLVQNLKSGDLGLIDPKITNQ
jgi:hypothetical protein